MQGIILTSLKHGIQIGNQRRPTAEVPYFAILQILHFESARSGVVGARLDPKPEREKVGAITAEFVHQSQCLLLRNGRKYGRKALRGYAWI